MAIIFQYEVICTQYDCFKVYVKFIESFRTLRRNSAILLQSCIYSSDRSTRCAINKVNKTLFIAWKEQKLERRFFCPRGFAVTSLIRQPGPPSSIITMINQKSDTSFTDKSAFDCHYTLTFI